MRPTYSPSRPMPNRVIPIKKNAIPKSVNTPSASGPTTTRRIARKITNATDNRAIAIPESENSCRGITENPVTRSKLSLVRLNFDLVTGFSVMPLQLFSLSGIAIALLSVAFVIFLAIRRVVVGPEAEGVFTLFGIAFFLIGITLFGIGLLGEYVGRIYEQVRQRPRYLVQAVLERKDAVSESPKQRQTVTG